MLSEYTVVVFLLNKKDLDDSNGQTQEKDQHRKKSMDKQGKQTGQGHDSCHCKHGFSESFAISSFVLHLCLMIIVDKIRVSPVNGVAKEKEQNGNCKENGRV